MKQWAILSGFLMILTLPSPGKSQNITPATTQVPNSGRSEVHEYQSKTIWGDVDVLVRAFPDHFQVEIQSEIPLLGWVLRADKGNHTLAKGGSNPTSQCKFEVQEPFQNGYKLTLYLNSDHEQVPILIHLQSQSGSVKKTGRDAGLEEFQDDGDHPYHRMVKNFYDQALDKYSKGDLFHAESLLKKAKELDPTQSQVQALLEKIRSTKEKPQDPMDKAKRDWKNGERETALAELEDILAEDPSNRDALALQQEIEGHPSKPKDRKSSLQKSKVEKPAKPSSPTEPKDVQAQADQAYNLGLESYRKNDLAAAKKFWEETLRIQPTHSQARRNLERLKQEHPDLK